MWETQVGFILVREIVSWEEPFLLKVVELWSGKLMVDLQVLDH